MKPHHTNNGCRGILTAMTITAIVLLLLFVLTSCNRVDKKRLESNYRYTVDKIKIDSVEYVIVNGNGTAIIKHEPR